MAHLADTHTAPSTANLGHTTAPTTKQSDTASSAKLHAAPSADDPRRKKTRSKQTTSNQSQPVEEPAHSAPPTEPATPAEAH